MHDYVPESLNMYDYVPDSLNMYNYVPESLNIVLLCYHKSLNIFNCNKCPTP